MLQLMPMFIPILTPKLKPKPRLKQIKAVKMHCRTHGHGGVVPG